MEPCRDIPLENDSLTGSLHFSTAWPKIFLKLLWWQVLQLYPQVLFSVSLPWICAAFTIIMASPEALLQLNNSTAAEKITRKQHYNRDVNMRHVNRSWADTSAWSVTPIINCQQCQCTAVFHMKEAARLTGWRRPALHDLTANKTLSVQQQAPWAALFPNRVTVLLLMSLYQHQFCQELRLSEHGFGLD